MDYLIIGNSAAAIGCVEGIRSVDPEGGITMLSRESQHTYSRPLISYFIQGKTDKERMKYRPDDFYDCMNCRFLSGRTVLSVDTENKNVTLDGGECLNYNILMVATGSNPFVPPMEGLETVENKFSFMSLSDADALSGALKPDSRVLIVGAGLIGLKCAEGIRSRCASIDVVDLADRVLPSILDGEGAEIVQKHIENEGVRFHLANSVQRFSPRSAFLKNGEEIPFDILVLAVGVRPNTALLGRAEFNRGIPVDARGFSGIDGVFAAGDCTQCMDISCGKQRVLALLPNAYAQGYCAGVNMAGGDMSFNCAMPVNAIGFFGLHIITAGSYLGREFTQKSGAGYKKLFVEDNLLKGLMMIGDVRRAGIYTALIRNRTPLDSIDFDLILKRPQLMAFSKAERVRQLGGAH